MFPDSLFVGITDDEVAMGKRMRGFFLKKYTANAEHELTPEMYQDYLRSVEKFRAICDPYDMVYTFPTIGNDTEENVKLIHDFFLSLPE